VLSRVLLLLLRLVVEQEGEVVSATNVVDVDADSDTELSPRARGIRVVFSFLYLGGFAVFSGFGRAVVRWGNVVWLLKTLTHDYALEVRKSKVDDMIFPIRHLLVRMDFPNY